MTADHTLVAGIVAAIVIWLALAMEYGEHPAITLLFFVILAVSAAGIAIRVFV